MISKLAIIKNKSPKSKNPPNFIERPTKYIKIVAEKAL